MLCDTYVWLFVKMNYYKFEIDEMINMIIETNIKNLPLGENL